MSDDTSTTSIFTPVVTISEFDSGFEKQYHAAIRALTDSSMGMRMRVRGFAYGLDFEAVGTVRPSAEDSQEVVLRTSFGPQGFPYHQITEVSLG